MPKGLAFLSKKSWHTSKICNQEKVWIAEQEKAAEDVKIKELAKQIQQEREEEELQRMSGKKSERLDRGIDWMYQHGGSVEEQRNKEAEEYLLGKEYNPNATKGDLSIAESNVGLNAVVTQATNPTHPPGICTDKEPNVEEIQGWKSDFHLRHEDPMFLVEKQRKDKEKEEERKRRLFESVNDNDNNERDSHGKMKRKKKSSRSKGRKERYDVDESEDDGYKRRRDDHRDRKSRKKERRREKRRRRSYSCDDEDSTDRYRRRSRSRRERESSRRRSQSRSTSISPKRRSPSREYRRDDEGRRKNRDSGRYASRDDDRNRTHDYGKRERRYERNQDNHLTDRYREDLSSRHHGQVNDDSNQAEKKTKSYGLVGSSSAKSSPTGRYLGPDQHLLAQKRRERDEQRSRYGRTSSNETKYHSRSGMSEEERAEALRAMQADATLRSDHLSQSKRTSNAELYEEELQRRKGERNGDDYNSNQSTFVQETTMKAHGIEMKSLSARVSHNRARR